MNFNDFLGMKMSHRQDSLYTGLPFVTYCLIFFTKNFIRNLYRLIERKSQIQRVKKFYSLVQNDPNDLLLSLHFYFMFDFKKPAEKKHSEFCFIREFGQKWDNHKLYQKVNQAYLAKCFVYFFNFIFFSQLCCSVD